uniref:Ribosomal protein S14 n=1 Tax=Sciaphila thaidanica TaxID=2161793 RepID=A0A2R4PAM8_9LILI|nr:ribosomal protein S14 [Sciaphila thaidanica]
MNKKFKNIDIHLHRRCFLNNGFRANYRGFCLSGYSKMIDSCFFPGLIRSSW